MVTDSAKLTAKNGSIAVYALGDDFTVSVILAAGGSTGQLALSGSIPVTISESDVSITIKGNSDSSKTELRAKDSIGIYSDVQSKNYIAAGALSASSNAAIGATVNTTIYQNRIDTEVGEHTLLESAGAIVPSGAITRPNRNERRHGIVISATGNETIGTFAVSGAAGTGSVAGTGVVNTLVVSNHVKATVKEKATLIAKGTSEYTISDATADQGEKKGSSGDIRVEADDESVLWDAAGALSASSGVGVGATVVVLTYNKETKADAQYGSTIQATGEVDVIANSKDDLYLLAIAFAAGATAGVAGNVNALVFNNVTEATVGSVESAKAVHVLANAEDNLFNIGASAAGGGTGAGTAVVVVTYFQNETTAKVYDNAIIGNENKKIAGAVEIIATSKEFVTADAAGISASGTAAVGGTFDIIVTEFITKAITGDNVKIYAIEDVKIKAKDSYKIYAVAATLAGSGAAGVGITALVSVSYNTVEALVGLNNVIMARDVIVEANSDRYILTGAANLVGAGVAGVAATVTIVLVGNKMSQDAHNTLYGKNEDGSTTSNTIDFQKQLDGAYEASNKGKEDSAKTKAPDTSLTELLEGDGQKVGNEDYSEYGQDTNNTNTNTVDENGNNTKNTSTFDQTASEESGIKYNPSTMTGKKDATTATIGNGSNVVATKDISVLAGDIVNANIITGSLAIGGAAGVGVGVSVVILHSNVEAKAGKDATLSANGKITIQATAGSKEEAIANINSKVSGRNDNSKVDTEKTNEKLKENDTDTSTTSTIRLISITGTGGFAGVGVSAALLFVYSDVNAILESNISRAETILVETNVDFGKVITINTSLSAGVVGVNVSAATTYFQANSVAAIDGNSVIKNVNGNIQVKTMGNTNAYVAAATIGAGGVAVNAGVAIAMNRSIANTYIGKDVELNCPNSAILVSHDYTSKADGTIISIAVGGVAVGASVVVVINALKAHSYIGTLKDDEQATGTVTAKAIQVHANANGISNANGVGVAGGAAACNGIVALAFNTIENTAAIARKNIKITNDIDVIAVISGDTQVITTAVIGGAVAVGATVAFADSRANNCAYIDLDDACIMARNVKINAGTEEKQNNSQALVAVVTGTVGGVAAAINIAIARNAGVNKAIILGTKNGNPQQPNLQANNLSIQAIGNGRAYSIIASAAAGIAAVNISSAYAWIKNEQYAGLDTKASIKVIELNVSSIQKALGTEAPKITINAWDVPLTRFNSMAEAYIFAAGAGAVAANASVATSLANATSKAIAKVSNLEAVRVIILNDAESYSDAKVQNAGNGAIAVGVLVGYSYASGTFEAGLEASGVIASNEEDNNSYVQITNTYISKALGGLTPALGGVSTSLINVTANAVSAISKSQSEAYLKGSGSLTIAGNADVINTGKVSADAQVRGEQLAVSAVKTAVNVVIAILSANQKAYVENKKDMVVGGNLNILSEIVREGEYGKTNAKSGGAEGKEGCSVALIGGNINSATAKAETQNNAYIKGTNANNQLTINGDLAVRAKTDTEVFAQAVQPTSASLATIGALGAYAFGEDKINATIESANIQIKGGVKVEGIGNATVKSLCQSGNVFALIGANGAVSEAKLGTNNNKQTVCAGIKKSNITAQRDVSVYAYNHGEVEALIEKGLTVGLGNLGITKLSTQSYYDTSAFVNENSSVVSKAGSVDIKSEDYSTAKCEINSNAIGVLLNAEASYGNNTINTTNRINIAGTIEAYERVSVLNNSNSKITASTMASGGGILNGNFVMATNSLTRDVVINILKNSILVANFGELIIQSNAGDRDNIQTTAEVTGSGAIAIGEAKAETTVNSKTKISVAENVLIQNRFGTVNIFAYGSTNKLTTRVKADASGLGVVPCANNKITANISSDITIGNANGINKIEGKNVSIISKIKEIEIYGYTYARGKSLGADIDAITDMNTSLLSSVSVDYTEVIGHNQAEIYASSKPAYHDLNIHGYSRVQLNAIGSAIAYAKGRSQSKADTTIGSHFTYKGSQITIQNEKFDDNRIKMELYTGGFIVKRTKNDHVLSNAAGSSMVADGATFVLGEAAGGIHIDVAEYNNILTIREVGVRNPDAYYIVNGNTIKFKDLSNNKPGRAYLYGTIGMIHIYNQAEIPGVYITNNASYNIEMGAVYLQNTGFVSPRLLGNVTQYTPHNTVVENTDKVVCITTRGEGVVANVKVGAFLSNLFGEISFIWTDGATGNLTAINEVTNLSAGSTVAPIWAHKLIIQGAQNIGEEGNYVNVYVFAGNNERGIIDIAVLENVYMKITPAILEVKNSGGSIISTYEDDLYVKQLSSENGNISLIMSEGIHLSMIENTTTVAIPVPGTLEYSEHTVSLAEDYSLSGMDVIEYYRQGYDSATGLYAYRLPNGSYFYMDQYGNVSRIEENDTVMAVGDYVFVKDSNGKVVQIQLSKGISIDLTTGNLTVDENASYEVLLSAIAGDWLQSQGLFNGGLKIRLAKSTSGADNVTDVIEWDVKPVQLYTQGNSIYYYLGTKPTLNPTNIANEVIYLLRYDMSDNSIHLFGMQGDGVEILDDISCSEDTIRKGNLKFENGSIKMHEEYYETKDIGNDALRDNEDWKRTYLSTLVRRADKKFEIQNFAGTSLTLIWDGSKLKTKDGKEIKLQKISGLGYTVLATQEASVAEAAALLEQVYFDFTIQSYLLDEVYTDDGSIKITKNDGDKFTFTELVYRDGYWFWQDDYYSNYSPVLNGYSLSMKYLGFKPANATLSTEYYSTGVRYETGIPNVYVYLADDGSYQDKDGNALIETRDSTTNSKTFVYKDGNGLTIDGNAVWYTGNDPIVTDSNGSYYTLDSHPEYYLFISKDNKISIVEKIETFSQTQSEIKISEETLSTGDTGTGNTDNTDFYYVMIPANAEDSYFTANYKIEDKIVVAKKESDEKIILYFADDLTSPITTHNVKKEESKYYAFSSSSENTYITLKIGEITLENLSKQETTEAIYTGDSYLTYQNGELFNGKKIFCKDLKEESYSTQQDYRNGKLIFRPQELNEDGTPSQISILGRLADIQIKEIPLPANNQETGKGYRVTDTMYLTKSGLVVTIKDNFSAKYDGSVYDSDFIQASKLGMPGKLRELPVNEEGYILYNNILYKQLGNSLIDVNTGNLLSEDMSAQILYSVIPTENTEGPVVRINKEQKIALEWITDKLLKDMTGKYYYMDGTVTTPQLANVAMSGTELNISYNGNIFLKITEAIEDDVLLLKYELPEYSLKIGSDGSIESTNENEPKTQIITKTQNRTICIGLIETKGTNTDVTIRVTATGLSLTDIENPGNDSTGIKTNGGNVNIYAQGGSIGSDSNKFDVNTGGGKFEVRNLNGEDVIAVDTRVVSYEDMELNEGLDTIVDGASYTVVSTGNITGTDLIARNGATVNLDSEKTITINNMKVISDDLSNLSQAYLVAAQGIQFNELVQSNKGKIELIATSGNILLKNLESVNSTIKIDAREGELRFVRIDSKESNLNLYGNKVVGFNQAFQTDEIKNAVIVYDKDDNNTNSNLQISSLDTGTCIGSIGEMDSHLYIDIPSAVVLKINKTGMLFIDGKEKNDSSQLYEKSQEYTGKDKEGNILTVEKDSRDIDEQTIKLILEAQSIEEIAKLVANGALSDVDSVTGESKLHAKIKSKIEFSIKTRARLLGSALTETGKVKEDAIRQLLRLPKAEFPLDEDLDITKLTQEQLQSVLVYMFDEKTKSEDNKPIFSEEEIIDLYFESLVESQKQELIRRAWLEVVYPNVEERTVDYKDLNVEIGTSTGEANINNNGTLNVKQENGTLTANSINSKFEDLNVDTQELSGTSGENMRMNNLDITASGSVSNVSINERIWQELILATIKGEKLNGSLPQTMPDNGTWNISRNVQTGKLEITFNIEFAQVKFEDTNEETKVTVNAGGNVSMEEVTGDAGINQITSNTGSLRFEACDGSVINVNSDSLAENIIVNQDAEIIADNGAIGTESGNINVKVEGTLTTKSKEDTHVASNNSLTMIGDTEDGSLYVTGNGDVNLSNTSGNLHVEDLNVSGNATVTSDEDILINQYQINGNTDISSQNGTIQIEDMTNKGSGAITMIADQDININKFTGIFHADKVVAGNDITLILDSSLTDSSNEQKVKELNEAIIAEALAKAKVEALENQIANEQEFIDRLEAAKQKVTDIKDLNDSTGNVVTPEEFEEILKQAVKDTSEKVSALAVATTLEEIIAAINNVISDEEVMMTTLTSQKASAQSAYQTAQANKTSAQSNLDSSYQPSIQSGNNLNITMINGGSIGKEDNALALQAGNQVSIFSGANRRLNLVNIETEKDLNMNPIVAEQVVINAAGKITNTDPTRPFITGSDVTLNSANNSIGDVDAPMILSGVSRLSALGNNVVIENDCDTQIGTIVAVAETSGNMGAEETGNVELRINGNISAKNTGNDNIIADNGLQLQSNGNIGSDLIPLKISTGSINAEGDNINMSSEKDVIIDTINANGDLKIQTDGAIKANNGTGFIKAGNVYLEANGNIGGEQNGEQLNISVYGNYQGITRIGESFALVRKIIVNNSHSSSADEGSYSAPVIQKQTALVKLVQQPNRVRRAGRTQNIPVNDDSEQTEGDIDEKPVKEETSPNKEVVSEDTHPKQENEPDMARVAVVLIMILMVAGIFAIPLKKRLRFSKMNQSNKDVE